MHGNHLSGRTPVPKPRGQVGGIIITTPLDGGPEVFRDTVQCGHCFRNWIYRKGSGNRLCHCQRCGQMVCPWCNTECVVKEQLLENMEAGMPFEIARLFRPIKAHVSTAPPR